MMRSIKAAGLESELNAQGPFTIFAPSEMAFGKLQEGQLTELLKAENKMKLRGIVNNHIVEGKKTFTDLKDGLKLKTRSGKELEVKVNKGNITINGYKLQGEDSEASNGMVHSLDTVIYESATFQ